MSFLLEFIKNPCRIGAVAPSGRHLSQKMISPIDFRNAKVIIEFGPGTGAFTKKLIANRNPDTVLLLIEQNPQFCAQLREKFSDEKNVHIIHGFAQDVNRYLRHYGFTGADYIVSGLPFTSLTKGVSDRILTAARTALGSSGQFITFQYSMVKRRYFEQYFRISDSRREMRNLPPAYVLVMENN